MRSEADTPIDQRYLWFEGRVSPASKELITPGLPFIGPPDTEVLFVVFGYADLPFPKRFDVVFPKGRPQDGVRCECTFIAGRKQFSELLPEIPHGWKTNCVVHFAGGIPQLVQQLPVVDAWHQNDEWVCICDEATWEHLKKAA
jgi:hypothetical protein